MSTGKSKDFSFQLREKKNMLKYLRFFSNFSLYIIVCLLSTCYNKLNHSSIANCGFPVNVMPIS